VRSRRIGVTPEAVIAAFQNPPGDLRRHPQLLAMSLRVATDAGLRKRGAQWIEVEAAAVAALSR
jgi:hypothetical protein